MENEKQELNFVQVNYKKSSSKDGKIGWDIVVKNTNASQKELDDIATIAINTAKKLQNVI